MPLWSILVFENLFSSLRDTVIHIQLGIPVHLKVWYRNHLSHCIQFADSGTVDDDEDARCIIDRKDRVEKWQDSLFFCRFDRLQQVEDGTIRCHLLGAALANHSCFPQRVYFLLSGNQDVFAK